MDGRERIQIGPLKAGQALYEAVKKFTGIILDFKGIHLGKFF